MSIGQIVQVIGAVVDIEFPRDEMPKVYDALVLEQDKTNTLAEAGLTFEVQQSPEYCGSGWHRKRCQIPTRDQEEQLQIH